VSRAAALLLAAAAALACAAPQPAWGAGLAPLVREASVRPGAAAAFPLLLDGTGSCSAWLPGAPPATLDTSRLAEALVSVEVPRGARAGAYRITLACSGLPRQLLELRVLRGGHRPARGSRAARPRLELLAGRAAVPAPEAPLAALAHRRWLQQSAAVFAIFRNGQCTDWAARKRPDVVERVYEATVVAELLGRPEPPQLEDAQTWAAAASAAGMAVGDRPAAGALVVWHEGVQGAAPRTGHVGYVESVAADGSTFSTSEMNFAAPYELGHRTLPSAPLAGRSFILP
jgi:surface antigen